MLLCGVRKVDEGDFRGDLKFYAARKQARIRMDALCA
jgi:hypothetical protein